MSYIIKQNIARQLNSDSYFFQFTLEDDGSNVKYYTLSDFNDTPIEYSNDKTGDTNINNETAESASNQREQADSNKEYINNQLNTNGNTTETISNVKSLNNSTTPYSSSKTPIQPDSSLTSFIAFINSKLNNSSITANLLLFDTIENESNKVPIQLNAWWAYIDIQSNRPDDWFFEIPVYTVLPVTSELKIDNVTFSEGTTLIIFDKVLSPLNNQYNFSFISTDSTDLINFANDNKFLYLNINGIEYVSNFTQDFTITQKNNENNIGVPSIIGDNYEDITLSSYSGLNTQFREFIYGNTTNKVYPETINTLQIKVSQVGNICINDAYRLETLNVVSYNNMIVNGNRIDSRYKGWKENFVGNFIDTDDSSFVNLTLKSDATANFGMTIQCIYQNFYTDTPPLNNGSTYNYVSFSNVNFTTVPSFSFTTFEEVTCGGFPLPPCPAQPPGEDISQTYLIKDNLVFLKYGQLYSPSSLDTFEYFTGFNEDGDEINIVLSKQSFDLFIDTLFLFVLKSSPIQLNENTSYSFAEKITTTDIDNSISYFVDEINVNNFILNASSKCFSGDGKISLTYFEKTTSFVYNLIFFTDNGRLFITNAENSPALINLSKTYNLSELSNNPIAYENSPIIANVINNDDWQTGTLSLGFENSLTGDNVYTIPIEGMTKTNSGIVCEINNRVVQYYPNTSSENKVPYIRQNIITIDNYSPIGTQFNSNTYYLDLIQNISASNPVNIYFIDDGSYITSLSTSPWINPNSSINIQVGGISQDSDYYYYFPVGNLYIENNYGKGNGDTITPPNANLFENANSPSVIKYIPILKSSVSNIHPFTVQTIKQIIIKSFDFIYNENDLNINLDDDNYIGTTYETGNNVFDTCYVNFKNWSFSVTSEQQLWYLLFYSIDFSKLQNGDTVPLTNFGITVLDFYPASAKQVMGHPLQSYGGNYIGSNFNTNINVIKNNVTSGNYNAIPVTYNISFSSSDSTLSEKFNKFNNFEFSLYTNTPDIEFPLSNENIWDNYSTSLNEKINFYNSVRDTNTGSTTLGGFVVKGYDGSFNHYKNIYDLSRAVQGLIIALSGNYTQYSEIPYSNSFNSTYGINTVTFNPKTTFSNNAPVLPKFWNSFFEGMLKEMQWSVYSWSNNGVGYQSQFAFNENVIPYSVINPTWRENAEWLLNNANYPYYLFQQFSTNSFNLPFITYNNQGVMNKIWNVNFSESTGNLWSVFMVLNNWWSMDNNIKQWLNSNTQEYGPQGGAFDKYGLLQLCNFCWYDVCNWSIAEVIFPNFGGACGKCNDDFLYFINYLGWGRQGAQKVNFNNKFLSVLQKYAPYDLPYVFPASWINQTNTNFIVPINTTNQLYNNLFPEYNLNTYIMIDKTELDNSINDVSKMIYQTIFANTNLSTDLMNDILSNSPNININKIYGIPLKTVINTINSKVLGDIKTIFDRIAENSINNIISTGIESLSSDFGSDDVGAIIGSASEISSDSDILIRIPDAVNRRIENKYKCLCLYKCQFCANNPIYNYYYKQFKNCAEFIKKVYYNQNICNHKLIKSELCSRSYKSIIHSDCINIKKISNNKIKITLQNFGNLYLYQYFNKFNPTKNKSIELNYELTKFLQTKGFYCKTAYIKFYNCSNLFILFFIIKKICVIDKKIIITAYPQNLIKNNTNFNTSNIKKINGCNATLNIDYAHTRPNWEDNPLNSTIN